MNLHVPHWSNLNCLRTHEMLRVLFTGKTHAFEVSQPRYLENPLATGRVAQSTAKSSPCRKYSFFFLPEEGKGEVCAAVRINPARSAPRSAGWGVGRSPGLCMHGASQSPFCHLPLLRPTALSLLLPYASRTDNPSLRNTPFSGNGTAYSQAMLHPCLSLPSQGTAARLLPVICF